MKSLHEIWNRYWYTPGSARNLACIRIVFMGLMFLFFVGDDFSAYAEIDDVFWMPSGLFKVCGFGVADAFILNGLQWTWKISLLAACVGFMTRGSVLIAFLIGLYLLGLHDCFGKSRHDFQILVFCLGALAFSRCGDALSVDAWLLRRQTSPEIIAERSRDGCYTWPIRFVLFSLVTIFFLAGIAKLRMNGFGWLDGENMQLVLTSKAFGVGMSPPLLPEISAIIARSSWACYLLAFSTLAFEITSPLWLISRRIRAIMLPASAAWFIGDILFMVPMFIRMLIVYAFFINWDWVQKKGTFYFFRKR